MGFWQRVSGLFKREAGNGRHPVATYRAGCTPLLVDGEATALSIATVYRCVKLLSESVANLPLRLQRRKDGIFVDYERSPLNYLLNVQPDAAVNAFDFWRQAVQNVLLEGNAYIVPVYNIVTMEIDRLVLCGRGTVNHDTVNDRYDVFDIDNGISGRYTEDEIIHIKGLTVGNSKRGLSVLAYARIAMSIAATGDRETRERFANGGNVRGLVSNDTSVRGFGEYQDKELERTAVNIDERFQSGERIVSLPGQLRFDQLSMSSTDMQFLESRKFTVREICRFFGVHPSFVFDDTSNNYKSAEQANVAFLSLTLNPLLRGIEVELYRKLVAPQVAHKYKIQFDRRGLYACDLDSRARYQAARLANGTASVNELRKEENMPPIPGGDRILVSANLRGIDEIGMQGSSANTSETSGDENDKGNDDDEE
ncbi:MAG: phage portal protein [Pseudoflavonifractor sp.]|nr:phage portal protein [Pseudoflavonifractor sp.]